MNKHKLIFSSLLGLLFVFGLFGCKYLISPHSEVLSNHHLAVANGDILKIVDVKTGQTVQEITRYGNITNLTYSSDGEKLAIVDCNDNRVIELETTNYSQLSVMTEGTACPFDLTYSPDNASLAVLLPDREESSGEIRTYLRVSGLNPVDTSIGGQPPALAYRPDGKELIIAKGAHLLGINPGEDYALKYSTLVGLVNCIGYSTEGSTLYAGNSSEYVKLNGFNPTEVLDRIGPEGVYKIVYDPTGHWMVFLHEQSVALYRTFDMSLITTLTVGAPLSDISFSSDGILLAVGETQGRIRVFTAPDWLEAEAISIEGAINAIDFKPLTHNPDPVVFIHGHSTGPVDIWMDRGIPSFLNVMMANPEESHKAYYMSLPLHGPDHPDNYNRDIAEDAVDILALIGGGRDSKNRRHLGLINLPRFAPNKKVSIVGFSQGGISARYYIKNLMGSRSDGQITVSEFVSLAAPNHGIAGAFCWDKNEPDKAKRQLCGGFTATLSSMSSPCQKCFGVLPPEAFYTYEEGDSTFLSDLNGHTHWQDCSTRITCEAEALHGLDADNINPDSILYANLFAARNADHVVGGFISYLDCRCRRQAYNHGLDAKYNIEIEMPGNMGGLSVHRYFPNTPEVICTVLQILSTHQIPEDLDAVCDGMEVP